MNHCVPEFEDESMPISSRNHKASLGNDEELVELLWQNGQVVMHTQNQKKGRIQQQTDAAPTNNNLFMQEDEMASWLHYSLDDPSFDRDFCTDLFYPGNTTTTKETLIPSSPRPPIPPPPKSKDFDSTTSKFHNFMHFSRPKSRILDPSTSDKIAVVASSETPRLVPPSLSTAESSGGSAASADQSEKIPNDRKRKAREQIEDQEFLDEDAKFGSETKKQVRGSTSARRSRAAEVHNLSERRRRDRINEKMKALQELIPRCNKSDKASMLDEAIEYLKSLQLQVQMMSMGCGMVPMMFPGVQQYITPMGMGMGMGMDMGMNRPMIPFPPVMPGAPMPRPQSPAHFGPRLPLPAFHPPPSTSLVDTSTNQTAGNPDAMQQIPNYTDPYQHYLSLHHMQQQPPCPPQSQAVAHSNTSKGTDSLENRKTG